MALPKFSVNQVLAALVSALVLGAQVACSNGGNLSLEPGARKIAAQGVPGAQINNGGQALVIEQGKTATTGVHGWVSIQSVSSEQLQGANGTTLLLNRKSF